MKNVLQNVFFDFFLILRIFIFLQHFFDKILFVHRLCVYNTYMHKRCDNKIMRLCTWK